MLFLLQSWRNQVSDSQSGIASPQRQPYPPRLSPFWLQLDVAELLHLSRTRHFMPSLLSIRLREARIGFRLLTCLRSRLALPVTGGRQDPSMGDQTPPGISPWLTARHAVRAHRQEPPTWYFESSSAPRRIARSAFRANVIDRATTSFTCRRSPAVRAVIALENAGPSFEALLKTRGWKSPVSSCAYRRNTAQRSFLVSSRILQSRVDRISVVQRTSPRRSWVSHSDLFSIDDVRAESPLTRDPAVETNRQEGRRITPWAKQGGG